MFQGHQVPGVPPCDPPTQQDLAVESSPLRAGLAQRAMFVSWSWRLHLQSFSKSRTLEILEAELFGFRWKVPLGTFVYAWVVWAPGEPSEPGTGFLPARLGCVSPSPVSLK